MFTQERLITRIQIMLPDMGGKPGLSHHPESGSDAVILGCRIPVQIRIVMGNAPSAAIHLLRRLLAALLHPLKQIKEGELAFA